MSIRIYPDFVVSVSILNVFRTILFLDGIKPETKLKDSNFIQYTDKILISAEGCVERQFKYSNEPIHIFVGYCSSPWTEDDYHKFFHQHSQIFRQSNELPGETVYSIDFSQSAEQNGNLAVIYYVKDFCHRLLTQGKYSPLFLQKYGII